MIAVTAVFKLIVPSPFWSLLYHLGGTVKSVLALLSVLDRPHFGCDLSVRRGSTGQDLGGKEG